MNSVVRHVGKRDSIGVPLGYSVTRVVAGTVLLVAAGLKAHEVVAGGSAHAGLITSRWMLIALVQFELVFGMWLLSGLYPRQTWSAALLCFAGLAGVALYHAIGGAHSCGCFGKLEVSPWYTAGFDLMIVAALLMFAPRTQTLVSCRHLSVRLAAIAMVALAIGLPLGVAMARSEPTIVAPDGQFIGDGRVVIVEPQNWIGWRLPLLEYIDIGEQLAVGSWKVVLYRHDCAACLRAIPKYERMADELAELTDPVRVALVEVPPYAPDDVQLVRMETRLVGGRLTDDRLWSVWTPTAIRIVDGVVIPQL